MLSRHLGLTSWIALLLCRSPVRAIPTISFPINAQVPPVARVRKPFEFIFASTTFSPTAADLRYAISNAPSWLKLDSASRTFSGEPTSADVGVVVFDLVATDKEGSETTSVTFIVSAEGGPVLGTPIADQLARFGPLSSSDALLLHPSSPVSVAFKRSTFDNINDSTSYYAVCANNTPLPSWLHFDPKTLSFTGSTPTFNSLSELPQDVSLHIAASDVVGFSAAVASFRIVISSHELRFSSLAFSIDAKVGDTIVYSGLQNALRLDGRPADAREITSISAMSPEWLKFDSDQMTLAGKVPNGASSQSFAVSVTDIYNEVAKTTVNIKVQGSSADLITGSIGTLYARPGTKFIYTFPATLIKPKNATISIDLDDLGSWLSFDEKKLTLSGFVPRDTRPQSQKLTMIVTADSVLQSQDFIFSIGSLGTSTSSSSSALVAATATAPTESSSSPGPWLAEDERSETKPWIAAAVMVPIALIAIMICAHICLRHRRRKKNQDEEDIAAVKRLISRPRPQSDDGDLAQRATDQSEKASPTKDASLPVLPKVRDRRSDAPSRNSMMESFTQHFGFDRGRPDASLLQEVSQLVSSTGTVRQFQNFSRNSLGVKRSRSSLRRVRTSGIPARKSTYGRGHGRALSTIDSRGLHELEESVTNALEWIQPRRRRHSTDERVWSTTSSSPSIATIEQMVDDSSQVEAEEPRFPLPPLSPARPLAERATGVNAQSRPTVRRVEDFQDSPVDRVNPRLSSFRRKRATTLMSPVDSRLHSLNTYTTSRLVSLFDDKENVSSPYHNRDSARRVSARRHGEMIHRMRSRDSIYADPAETPDSTDSGASSPQRWTRSNPPSDLKKAAEFLKVQRTLSPPQPLRIADPRAALASHPSQEALSVTSSRSRSRVGRETGRESRARRPISIESSSKVSESQKGTIDSLGHRFL